MKVRSLLFVTGLILISSLASAQFYVGPNVGFKASGLKGVVKLTRAGGVDLGQVGDAGKTGFNAGVAVGYQVLSPSPNSWYKLDINLDISYSNFSYFEAGYNSGSGGGSFSANGFSGGATNIISFDIMPIHRLNIPSFRLLSPFMGLGVGMNYMMTKDVSTGPPSTNGTFTGNSEFKIGLLVFYGTLFQVNDWLQPYIL